MTSWFSPILLVSFAATALCSEEQEWIEEDWDLLGDEYLFRDPIADAVDTENSQGAVDHQSQHKHSFLSQSSKGDMFSSAQPSFKSGWGVIAFGDWLYWKASEEGLEYGVQSLNYSDREPFRLPIPTRGIDGKVSKVSPGFHSGFRLGLIGIVPRDKWDCLLAWTCYHNDAGSAIKQKSTEIVWPILLNNNNVPIALSAQANWQLDVNVLDLELGRSFFVAKHLSLRPFIAFQAAWIEQKLNVDYLDLTFLQNHLFPTAPTISSRNRNDFSGYGLRAGINTKWPLHWGLSIVGNASFSLLCSGFDINQRERNFDGSPRTHLKDHLHLTSQVLQLFGGLYWEWQFKNNRYYVNVRAGWEQQVWFDQNQMDLFLNNSILKANIGNTINKQGDLTLSGLTLGAGFGF